MSGEDEDALARCDEVEYRETGEAQGQGQRGPSAPPAVGENLVSE